MLALALFGAALAELPYITDFSQVAVKDTDYSVSDVNKLNAKVSDFVQSLSSSPYFSAYKVDLTENLCPFTDDTGFCGNRACAIEPMDEDLPEQWQTQFLGRLRTNSVSEKAPVDSMEDCAPEQKSIYAYLGRKAGSRDYCFPEDERNTDAVWVDLNDNIERYTGYGGSHAHKVWHAVYQENCFGYKLEDFQSSHQQETSKIGEDAAGLFMDEQNRHSRQEVGGQEENLVLNTEQCVEQRLFYKLLSGMHTSISSHLSYDWLNKTSGEWEANTDLFMDRVGNYPERLNNLYFNYVLVARAIAKLETYLSLLSFSTSCESVDQKVRTDLWKISAALNNHRQGLNETQIFSAPELQLLKEEFRSRVRNVNALMSCVGCERCRLWGKIQTAGYGTALKLLFELPEQPAQDPARVREVLSEFKRSELVALVQTFSRLSHSIFIVQYFGKQVEARHVNIKSFSYQMKLILSETKTALGFILKAYIDFPKNLWRLFIFYVGIYWNLFIGRPIVLDVKYEL